MKYKLLTFVMIMGIHAYLFGKRFHKDNVNQAITELNDEVARNQTLINLNKRLFDLYEALTQEQDDFEIKRNIHATMHENLKNKKVDVENRLQYLEETRDKVDERFKDRTTSIQEFKELCSMFVSTHDDIEKIQMEIHESEIELEIYLESWNRELLEHNDKVMSLRKDIDAIIKDISQLNGCEVNTP